jgi:hypothetical protein
MKTDLKKLFLYSGQTKLNFKNIGGGRIIFRPFKFLLLAMAFFSVISNETSKLVGQTDTMICDNGGFESNFNFYFGQTDTYTTGSDNCSPLSSGSSVNWNNSTLPNFRRFEITTSGVDTLVGIVRTKFGSKAAIINNRYGHRLDSICFGHFDANKLVKRFKVTEENRDFTLWFAAVLENPAGHSNSQPFFSIKCDRAPDYDLCFDASIVSCEASYIDSLCNFSTIDVVGWTCHRIKIPKNMIDSVATLEIIAADCGCGAHFGYAYIDGICEECDGSVFGSGKLYDNNPPDMNGLGISYDGCLDTLSFCGTYELPTLCGRWKLDSIKMMHYSVYNLVIDTTHHKFCFKIPLSAFSDTCVELFAKLYFSSQYDILDPVFTNSVIICPGDFEKYEVTVYTGVCQDNNSADLISDDYYYVQVNLSHLHGDTFTIERWLDDPYPNESGYSIIRADTGDGSFNLGPFYIQEGSWKLIVKFGNCADTFQISPPYFCSGCNKFYRTTISNITCYDNGTYSIADDTWSFDIYVQGTIGHSFYIGATTYTYNSTHTINKGVIGQSCVSIRLEDFNTVGVDCFADLMICPPKPCSDESNCQLEIYLKEVYCNEEEDEFYIEVDTSNVGTGYLCYKSYAISAPTTLLYGGSFGNPIGSFTEDVFVVFYVCSTSACDCEPSCFKVMYFPKPDCENLDYRRNESNQAGIRPISELMVFPNPVHTNEITLRSTMESTIFEFYNSSLKLIYLGSFTGSEFKIVQEIPSGLYFVRFRSTDGKHSFVKVIKI